MGDTADFLTITVSINTRKYKATNGKFHIQTEQGITQEIDMPDFRFLTPSMNVAISKIKDIVSRHPEDFFIKIIIG